MREGGENVPRKKLMALPGFDTYMYFLFLL